MLLFSFNWLKNDYLCLCGSIEVSGNCVSYYFRQRKNVLIISAHHLYPLIPFHSLPQTVTSSFYYSIILLPLLLSTPLYPGTLPQNLRIISNFFRTAPDGTVRGFSIPIVHERNKNATTAAIHMGKFMTHKYMLVCIYIACPHKRIHINDKEVILYFRQLTNFDL